MYERMLSKEEMPTIEELIEYCGQNGERFVQLNQWLSDTYGTIQQIVFPYGHQYGWGIAHRKNKKLICNIFAEDNAFTVMLRLSDKQYDSLYESLHQYTKDYIDAKYTCGDGGWIQYRITASQHFEDIKKLLTVKCS